MLTTGLLSRFQYFYHSWDKNHKNSYFFLWSAKNMLPLKVER